jgi:RNA polymerase sigma factor (sigma-70 family)
MLRRFTRGMLAQTLDAQTDRQLVEQFLVRRDEAVFEVLLRRHGPMVYRVCWRVLQQAQDTEDAFQATFLLLAQKLQALRKFDSLASWLHGVARRVALKARAQAAARQRRERRTARPLAMLPEDITWSELRTLLDAELAGLPDKWRLPLVLCYLEGRTQDEAAGQLRWSKNTLRRRLEEARAALGRRLSQGGAALPAALTAALFADCAAGVELPARLLGATAGAAVGVVFGPAVPAGMISTRVAALTEGVLPAMLISRLKGALVALLAVTLLGLGLAAAGRQPGTVKEPARKPTAPQLAAGGTLPAGASAQDAVQAKPLLEQALQTAGKIEDLETRASVLAMIARAQARAGQKDAAGKTFAQAAQLARGIKEDYPRAQWFAWLARTQSEAGDFDAAFSTAATIQEPAEGDKQRSFKNYAWMWIAICQAEAGDIQAALTNANAIEEPEPDDDYPTPKSMALCEIAKVQARSGKVADGLKTAGAIKNKLERCSCLAVIAVAQARAKDLPAAQKTLQEALDIANSIQPDPTSSSDHRAFALIHVAGAQAALGDVEGAVKLALSLPTPERYQSSALYHIVEAQVNAGDFQGALRTAKAIQHNITQEYAIKEIALAQARAGDVKAALATIKEVKYVATRVEVLVAAARYQAKAGDHKAASKTLQQAMQEMDRVEDPPHTGGTKPALVREIAAAQAAAGDARAVLAWAEKLADPRLKTVALLGLAEGLTARGNPVRNDDPTWPRRRQLV